jgi:putative spermidine/putrescine transport system permease protein
MESRAVRILLRIGTVVTLLFLYIPLVILALYAFDKSITRAWPPQLWTLHWFKVAWHDPDLPPALIASLKAAVFATLIALILGSLAAAAVHRFRFFGRNTLSFALILPIALPGILTGLALSNLINEGNRVVGITYGLATVIVGHSTFCIVVVYNNVISRMRRTPTSYVEASMDLGADGWTTFRWVTFPAIRTALVAGGLLAFALSFDEIVVTNFTAGPLTTLPIWVYNNIREPHQQPVVNAVALVLMIVSIVPVYFAQRLAGGLEGIGTPQRGAQTPPRMLEPAAGEG